MIHETLSPASHGLVDYVSVVAFALAPTLFQFGGLPAFVAYGLALVHLLLTLATRFPMGLFDGVPLRAHGVVELVVSVVLIVLPWVAGFVQSGAQWFFPAMGILIFSVWLLSDYGTPSAVGTGAAPGRVGPPERAGGGRLERLKGERPSGSLPGTRRSTREERDPGARRQPAEDEGAGGKQDTGEAAKDRK